MKERKLDEEARKIATVKRGKYYFDEYKDICSKIEENEENILKYDDFLSIGKIFTSKHYTGVNGKLVTIEPSLNQSEENTCYHVVGCAAKESIKEILSCMDNHKEFAGARIQVETLMRKGQDEKGKIN
eukprot:13543350-Ditylum_brightwellii.AAC.1